MAINEFTYKTTQNGYVIYDKRGKKIDPWDVIDILNTVDRIINLVNKHEKDREEYE